MHIMFIFRSEAIQVCSSRVEPALFDRCHVCGTIRSGRSSPIRAKRGFRGKQVRSDVLVLVGRVRPPFASRKNKPPVAFLLADAAGFGLKVWILSFFIWIIGHSKSIFVRLRVQPTSSRSDWELRSAATIGAT